MWQKLAYYVYVKMTQARAGGKRGNNSRGKQKKGNDAVSDTEERDDENVEDTAGMEPDIEEAVAMKLIGKITVSIFQK